MRGLVDVDDSSLERGTATRGHAREVHAGSEPLAGIALAAPEPEALGRGARVADPPHAAPVDVEDVDLRAAHSSAPSERQLTRERQRVGAQREHAWAPRLLRLHGHGAVLHADD